MTINGPQKPKFGQQFVIGQGKQSINLKGADKNASGFNTGVSRDTFSSAPHKDLKEDRAKRNLFGK